jgi:uncharacterized protein (DUF1697 family)
MPGKPPRFAAFLRGINVGGRKAVKMAELRAAFEMMGLERVETVLASGNVLFEVPAGVASAGVASAGVAPAWAVPGAAGWRGAVATPQEAAPEDMPADVRALAVCIETRLQRVVGYPIPVLVRELGALRRLGDSDPFKGVAVDADTRLYVTFISDPGTGRPDFAYVAPEGGLTIERVSPGEVCSVVVLSPTRKTADLMALLEREFGPGITTRNWNTVAKILGG